MSFKNITELQRTTFLSALRAGQYNLLLGAGSSMDSENPFGKFPSGTAFKNELCALKGVSENYPLQRVYSLLKAHEIATHVTSRFSGARPGATAKLISSFIWRRIFTWNIDDVFEVAYKDREARQKLLPRHFSDEFEEAETLEDLLLVHLHGSVVVPEKGYVFSRNEYINNIRNISHWMTILTQLMQTEPLIIAGTSLDEVDLEFYLSHRTRIASREDRGPSILVEMNDDAISQDICERHNLLHFVGHSHDFFAYCAKELPNRPTPYELIPLETQRFIPLGVSKAAALAFQSDFELVPATGEVGDGPSRFLYGHPPTWHDLANGLDISRPIVSEVVAEVERLLTDVKSETRLVLVSENAGTGKTTVIRRAAFELAGRGVRVLLCSALGRIGKASAGIIDLVDFPLVIVVDNFADQVGAIIELLGIIEKKDVVCLAAERSYRSKYLQIYLGVTKQKIYDELPLRENDVSRLIDQYLKFGLIGDHTALKNRIEFNKRIVSDPIAIACCRIMNDFSPLDKIVNDLMKAVSSEELDRYLVAAIARLTFTGGVRYEILNSAVNNVGFIAQMESDHALPLAYSDKMRTFVVPENTTLGERVLLAVAELDRKRLLKCFVALANGIAPRVNRQMIIRRSPEARMTTRLFDYDDVVRRLLKDDAGAFYEKVRTAWKWNSRYWEQVALLNLTYYYGSTDSEIGKQYLLDAVQHARHAVSIEHHPFTLSTLGKVLMTQSLSTGTPRSEMFDEALARLSVAIELEGRWARSAPHPYFSLFNGTISYLEHGGVLTAKQVETIKGHMQSAQTRFLKDNEVHELLGSLGRRMQA
jgi:hypothetical protein